MNFDLSDFLHMREVAINFPSAVFLKFPNCILSVVALNPTPPPPEGGHLHTRLDTHASYSGFQHDSYLDCCPLDQIILFATKYRQVNLQRSYLRPK